MHLKTGVMPGVNQGDEPDQKWLPTRLETSYTLHRLELVNEAALTNNKLQWKCVDKTEINSLTSQAHVFYIVRP